MSRKRRKATELAATSDYDDVLTGVVDLLEAARRTSARAVNAVMTAAYWEIGRRIVECEQSGEGHAEYGSVIVTRLARDLTKRFGRGFGKSNLYLMRALYLAYGDIFQTVSGKFAQTPSAQSGQSLSGNSAESDSQPIFQTLSAKFDLPTIARRFPLPWSHYVRLLKVEKAQARRFYETEALRGGWSVRQLDRQISTLFYERTLASRNKRAMLKKGGAPRAGETPTAEEEIKDPLVLEFLGLKDEYSETDLEEALIRQLENFLLELGGDFTFVGRQKRLRLDDEWYRVDLLFFHRTLRCLVVIDLKVGKFTHADAGQMLLYLGYAAEHWTRPGENPPVGLILCAQHNRAVAHYALDRLPNKVLAAEYRMALPDEKTLEAELERTQSAIEHRPPPPKRKPPKRKRSRK
jgi:predicted nuclease of restriction endonuclease-like (RecB) superfamily